MVFTSVCLSRIFNGINDVKNKINQSLLLGLKKNQERFGLEYFMAVRVNR